MRRQICNKVRHSGGVRHPVVDSVSIFLYTSKSIVLATHVNNILVLASNTILINNLFKEISSISKLEITNLGEIEEFLKVEIIRERKN